MQREHSSFPVAPQCPHLESPVYESTYELLDAILQRDFGTDGYQIATHDKSAIPTGNQHLVKLGYSSQLTNFKQLPTAQFFSIEAGSDDPEEVIILLSGYGWGTPAYLSTLIAFLRLQESSDTYKKKRLCILDWMGTAASSRPPWNMEHYPTHDEVSLWFADSLHEWCHIREYDSQIKSLVLGGHSVGAYYISRFVLNHSYPAIKRLLLLSPCGFAEISDQQLDPERFPVKISFLQSVARHIQGYKKTPMELLSFFGKRTLGFLLRGYAKNRAGIFFNRDEELNRLIHQWLVSNYYATSSADKGFHVAFDGVRAHFPIRFHMADLKVPNIEIFYGNEDWMSPCRTILTLQEYSDAFGGEFHQQPWDRLNNDDRFQGPRLSESVLTYTLEQRTVQPGWDRQRCIKVIAVMECGHQIMLDQGEISAAAILGEHTDGIACVCEWQGRTLLRDKAVSEQDGESLSTSST